MKIKICGITSLDDALLAVEAGADALGFVFYKASPRFIEPEDVGLIIEKLPPFVTPVGVFVDAGVDEINMAMADANLDCVQLHGSESPEFCHSLNARVIKAFRVGGAADVDSIGNYAASAYLLDAFSEEAPGGTGKTFDWALAVRARAICPGPMILSGGLTPENVLEAIEQVRPYAVDVSSGVESSPGVKDADRVKSFIEQVRRYE